ncbi:MAG: restriction endonuclease subunit S, partial [Clostridia bacterium]
MKYKEFKLNEIFNIIRGTRLIKLNQEEGDIAYISSTKFNNGVDNYINPPDYIKIYKNCLTITNSGSLGYTFYHDYNFVASDHVTILECKTNKLNKYTAMFFIPILNMLRDKYSFNREMSNKRLEEELITLPIDEN